MELLKKLFKKLGKQVGEKGEAKSKSLRLSTTISVHDLENKKRKAVEFLKQYTFVKFYMKVNIYDPENIQKGRLMLLNIAEDLKEYAKVQSGPDDDLKATNKDRAKKPGEKKPSTMDEISKAADMQKMAQDVIVDIDDSDYDEEDPESRP